MPDLSPNEHMRCVALEAASRCVLPDTSTSGLLSRARQAETYLTTGLVRTGAQFLSAVEIGGEGVSVTVEAPGLDSGVVDRLRVAVAGVLSVS